ncbi:MAG: hypothetical protein EOP52_08055 [Sphingobacteriales bacterium]|nr:MAG: hypothetical protein EOP52_08055 [Sphingobacteriales bacterium]
MDAKLLFIKAPHLIYKSDLDKQPLGGWIYCGTSVDLQTPLLEDGINACFPDEELYFIRTRIDSQVANKRTSLSLIKQHIDVDTIILFSKDFKVVIEFGDNGVFRSGRVHQ